MKTTVEFDYSIGEEVKIKALNLPGRIDGLLKDIDSKQYYVIYWCNGERRSTRMYDWEIEPWEKPA